MFGNVHQNTKVATGSLTSRGGDGISPPALLLSGTATAKTSFVSTSIKSSPVAEAPLDSIAHVSSNTDMTKMPLLEVKKRLVELVSKINAVPASAEDLQLLQDYINVMEDRYEPAQTLDFLNLAMGGTWQMVFSTSSMNRNNENNFRLRDMDQKLETNELQGFITNTVQWDLADNIQEDSDNEDDYYDPMGESEMMMIGSSGSATSNPVEFDCFGTFAVKCKYEINQGARMMIPLSEDDIEEEDSVLSLSKGSNVPSDIPKLVGLLARHMPRELFDPKDHIMDTTYLDGDLRLVRYSGPKHEAVRDIFIRKQQII